MLEISNLEVYYGVIQAIKGISFEVNEGEIVALIGANDAGEATILHTTTGLVPSSAGKTHSEGKNITRTPGYKIVPTRVAHVPEGRWVFSQLSVYENLKLDAYTRKDKNEFEEALKMICGRFPRLEERKNQLANTLIGGEQQVLAMGRVLMSHPELIAVDEPSIGLSPIYVNEIFDIVQEINKTGTTVFLVGRNTKRALPIIDKAYVLEIGQVALSGDTGDLMNNDSIRKAHLSG